MKTKPAKTPLTCNAPSPEPSSTLNSAERFSLNLRTILVPIDFSDCSAIAFDCAVALAQKFAAAVTLFHVVEPVVYQDNPLMTPLLVDQTNQGVLSAARERLAKLGSQASAIKVDILVRVGRAASEITDTAKATDSDLIVMGTHGHSRTKHILLGGTAERVVRQAHCPVLTVRLR